MSSDDERDSLLKWAKNAVDGLFDAWIGSRSLRDEEGWERFLHLVDEAGRLILRFPSHTSSESDIFGALDDIAEQLEGTKNAITIVATEARIVMGELHKALEPLLPGEGDDLSLVPQAIPLESPSDLSLEKRAKDSLDDDVIQKGFPPAAPVAAPDPVAQPARVSIAARPPGDDVECEGCHQRFKKGPGIAAHRRACRALHPEGTLVTRRDLDAAESVPGGSVTPSEEDERYFEAIRRLGKYASYADVARDTGAKNPGRIHQRFDLLASYYTLPSDIAVWRAHRSTRKGGYGTGSAGADSRIKGAQASEAERVREVAAEIKAREPETRDAALAEEAAFAERRRQAVAEKVERDRAARAAGG